MDRHQDYATIGLKALQRAAYKAIVEAKKRGLRIPVWKDGKIEYISPDIDTEQSTSPDCDSTELHRGR